MNSLNSIIIEGNFTAGVRMTENRYEFFIDSKLYYRESSLDKPKRAVKTITVRIACTGKLADSCEKHLTEGRGLRVVGRLDTDENNLYVVFAEHVEFRPEVS